MNARAFLGPIGDDLPSLIPLIIGLVVFFSTFTFAFQSFDEGNRNFTMAIQVVKLAQALKGDSYVASFSAFQQSCAQASVRGLHYYAAVVDYSQLPDPTNNNLINFRKIIAEHRGVLQSVADDPTTPGEDTGKLFECTNNTDGPVNIPTNAKVLVRMFPMAVQYSQLCSDPTIPTTLAIPPQVNYCTQTGFLVKPAVLVVAAWR